MNVDLAITNGRILDGTGSPAHRGSVAIQERRICFVGPGANLNARRTIDAAGMVKVAAFAKEAIQYLAEREEPMTAAGTETAGGHPRHPGAASKPKTGRRVSLGTMPDFEFSGEGVRISAVSPESPAAKGGLQKGDIIKQIGKFKITKIKI